MSMFSNFKRSREVGSVKKERDRGLASLGKMRSDIVADSKREREKLRLDAQRAAHSPQHRRWGAAEFACGHLDLWAMTVARKVMEKAQTSQLNEKFPFGADEVHDLVTEHLAKYNPYMMQLDTDSGCVDIPCEPWLSDFEHARDQLESTKIVLPGESAEEYFQRKLMIEAGSMASDLVETDPKLARTLLTGLAGYRDSGLKVAPEVTGSRQEYYLTDEAKTAIAELPDIEAKFVERAELRTIAQEFTASLDVVNPDESGAQPVALDTNSQRGGFSL